MTDKDKNINIIDSIRRIRDSVLRDLIRAECDWAAEGARINVRQARDDFGYSGAKGEQRMKLHRNKVKEKKDLLSKWDEILTYTIEMFV